MLFTEDVRCPVHLAELAAAVLELGALTYSDMHYAIGEDLISRYELSVLIAGRDGLDASAPKTGVCVVCGVAGPVDVPLDRTMAWIQCHST